MSGWQSLAAEHKEKQRKAIPAEWTLTDDQIQTLVGDGTDKAGRLIELQSVRKSGLLSEEELSITEDYTATQLLDKIALRELKSVDVVTAFAKRAAIAQQLTSCLTEIFFDEAIERARWLDRYQEENGKVLGPLHGLPISLKDTFVVKGHHATVGYVEYLKRPVPDTNSSTVDLILEGGAVVFCKTNIPQGMMSLDSINNIFGRTLNPHNTKLTPGGSSGGEGVLLALRGSPLGIGTDLGGSLRFPAAYNGIYSLRPTSNRVSLYGQNFFPFPFPHLPGINATAGPMGNSVQDLNLFMKVATSLRPWKYDANILDLPWRSPEPLAEAGKLTIGILPDIKEYPLHPPVRRTMNKAVAALEKAGHNVIHLAEADIPNLVQALRIAWGFFGLGSAGLQALEDLIGEPLLYTVRREPHPFSDGKFAVSTELGVPEQLSALHDARDAYAQSWKQAWLQHNLDVIVSPCGQHTAVPHDSGGLPPYTIIWNVLDYAAGIIPFGKASKEEDPEFQDMSHIPFEPNYDPEVIDGAPTALQIIAPRLRDEECLEAMRIIDRDIRLE